MTRPPSDGASRRPSKKTYAKPVLVTYGGLTSLTGSTGMGAIMDGSNPGNDSKSV